MKISVLFLCAFVAACAATPPRISREQAASEVDATERAFAKTMADRDFAAFESFLSEEAIFLGGKTPLRGRAEVAAAWKRYFEKPQAPFAWRPRRVEALASGTLAHSSGPVFDPGGKCIGTFASIWRLEAPQRWRIVFDAGNEHCDE